MKNPLAVVNPKTRDQGMRLATVAIAGPALLYAGYRFPGSGPARGALALLGAALIYTNYHAFREVFDGEEDEEVDLLLLSAG